MNYFDDPGSKLYSFESFAAGLAEDSFAVINFKGFEAISHSYDFEIMLVSSEKEVDLEELLQAQALFTIHRSSGDDVLYNGILAEFDQLHEVNDLVFYRARLVPRLWWLNLTHHNQVFLNQSVIEFVEGALTDGGLETADFDLSTLSGYEPMDYTCQYDETHFNFVSRWLERNGIYYYFDQQADGEILTLTDTRFSHDALKQGADLFYNPASGLETAHLGEAIGSFTCRQKQLPKEIILKDYNYQKPSLDITSRMEVDPAGRGLSYLYGEFFATPEEGERFASIRAEELLCQKREFFGESTVPYIMPGFTFNLHNHYREEFNSEYLITEVTHEGNQSHLMSGGIASHVDSGQNLAIYHNSFKAIPGEVQFRPSRITEKPKISGTIHAKIDSEVDSEYAQIDEQGRYRVKLPFDINDDNIAGKGSAPIRMMQSYAGKNRGMQFPLVKGTEVLLTFIEGNPDRPVIAGAVSNPENIGPVNHDNQSESVIQSGGNNKIRIEDKLGKERIMLESPAANSWIRIGSTNDPITLQGNSPMYVDVGATFTDPQAVSVDSTTDPSNPVTSAAFDAMEIKDADGNVVTSVDTSAEGVFYLKYEDTNNTTDTAYRTVMVTDPARANDLSARESDGVRIRSAGDLWLEAKSRYGEYYVGKPSIPASGASPSQAGDMLANFNDGYKPKNLLNYSTGISQCTTADEAGSSSDDSFANALANGHVRVSSLDTFNTQEGNIYDFGGYWNYNLGNSYTENHIDQCAELNKQQTNPVSGPDGGKIAGFVVGSTASAIFPVVVPLIVSSTAATQGGAGGAIASGFLIGGTMSFLSIASTILGHSIRESTTVDSIDDVISGPNEGEIKTWANKVKSSINSDQPMNTSTTWVEKNIGDSYSYTKGNSLEISLGDSEVHSKGDVYEYTYGGAYELHKYSKGRISHWERSKKGEKISASWNSTSGQFESFSYAFKGFFSFKATMPTLPKLDISVAMSSMDAKIAVSAGTFFNIKLAASVSFDIDLAASFSAKFTRKVGGEVTWNEVTGKKKFKAFGLEAAKEEAMKAKKQELIMEKVTTLLDIKEICLINSKLRNEEYKLKTNMGNTFFL